MIGRKGGLRLLSISLAIFASFECFTTYGASMGVKGPEGWDVRLGLPLWITGSEGVVAADGREARADENFSDILDNLDFTIAGDLEVRRNHWLIYGNGLFQKTST